MWLRGFGCTSREWVCPISGRIHHYRPFFCLWTAKKWGGKALRKIVADDPDRELGLYPSLPRRKREEGGTL